MRGLGSSRSFPACHAAWSLLMAAGAAGGNSADRELKARGQRWSRRTSLWGLQQAAAECLGNLFIGTPSGGQGPFLWPPPSPPHLGRSSAHLRRTARTPRTSPAKELCVRPGSRTRLCPLLLSSRGVHSVAVPLDPLQ